LATEIGDGQPCAKVPEWVKKAARGHIDLNAATAKRKAEATEDRTVKRGPGGLAGLQAQASGSEKSQTDIRSHMSPQKHDEARHAILMLFYEAGIPFNVAPGEYCISHLNG
jgi:hypothetical protein